MSEGRGENTAYFGIGWLLNLPRLMADSVRKPEDQELNSPLKNIEWGEWVGSGFRKI